MRPFTALLLLPWLLAAGPATPAKTETLHYNLNWPSGLSLGEAEWSAVQDAGRRSFRWHIDAAIPGLTLAADSNATADQHYCAAEFEKTITRGRSKATESVTFDPKLGVAKRETKNGGGKSEVSIGSCPKDALTYLAYARSELQHGRLPAAQTVFFGAPYQVRLQYRDRQNIQAGGSTVEADRLTATIKGAAADLTADIFFAHDAQRTPVLIRVPLPLGTFSLEISR